MASTATRCTLVLGVLFGLGTLPAALAQTSEGGTPPSFHGAISTPAPTVTMEAQDNGTLLAKTLANPSLCKVYEFGKELTVNLSVLNSGTWTTNPDGSSLWRLRVASPAAYSLNFAFSRYDLPAGAKLWIYNDAHSHVLGAYTASNRHENGQFACEPCEGDAVTFEYLVPAGTDLTKNTLTIGTVVHAYRDVMTFVAESAPRLTTKAAGACEKDTKCPEAVGWELQVRATVRTLLGGSLCTAALINNARNDGTRYVWSAFHCGSMNNAVFLFKYEKSACGSGTAPTNNTVSGSVELASNSNVDYRLARITPVIPASYNAYYMGWNRSATAIPTSTVTIHHPTGDVKKWSKDNNPPSKQGVQWHISQWDIGVTEPGSSGCPLFDQNKRFIGELWGGQATCSFLFNDYYGRFDQAWNTVKTWLDPDNTGITTLDGFDPNAPANCGTVLNYNAPGCPGTFGITPTLGVSGCMQSGGSTTLAINLGLGGAPAFLFFGAAQANLSMGGGCFLKVTPLLPVIVGPLALGGVGPGTGTVSLPATLPAGIIAGTKLTLQAFITDNGSPKGFSNTNGVEITFG